MKIIQGLGGRPSEPAQAGGQGLSRPGNSYNVLFLCVDNSICSIMAEALLKRWGGEDFRAFSAGIEPKGEVHSFAADCLKARRVWHQGLQTKNYREFLAPDAPPMDFIISVGERPPVGLPAAWPGRPRVIHWHISEPEVRGRPAETATSFRKTFTELENRIRLFVLVYQKDAMKKAATAA